MAAQPRVISLNFIYSIFYYRSNKQGFRQTALIPSHKHDNISQNMFYQNTFSRSNSTLSKEVYPDYTLSFLYT